MYSKNKTIPLRGSASALCNNLALNRIPEKNLTTHAVVHRSAVNLVTVSGPATGEGQQNFHHRQVTCREAGQHTGSMVLQAKWCQLATRNLLVITSQKGVQIFEQDGAIMVFWHALGAAESVSGYSTFARGVAPVAGNLICVGTSSGNVLCFNIPPKGPNVTLTETMKGHSSAITDITSTGHTGDTVVTADDSGNIIVWKGPKFVEVTRISGSRNPACCVCLWKDTVIAAYSTGHIRLFGVETGNIHAEVCAHARWISSLDILPESGQLLSASEDSYARIWQLKKGNTTEVEHVHSECVTDIQLCGAKFTSPEGKAFAVTGYDTNEIIYYVQN
ncbi:WD repeat-containing protein 54-like [Branchiostoma floridae x Branchiostoma belcheri]|nr:WD repeat-containing protein 54 [Branchiostoma belcheri]